MRVGRNFKPRSALSKELQENTDFMRFSYYLRNLMGLTAVPTIAWYELPSASFLPR
jgi:hypothetical protein